MNSRFSILSFSPELALDFKKINEEWIREMFALEPKDHKVLNNPKLEIIDKGGYILFIKDSELGIIGTAALLKTAENEFELTKMGILEKARGRNLGGILLQAIIGKALDLGCKNLYLLTNKKCKAAIHLYEKNGFLHDAEIMSRFGTQYARCDVAMRYLCKKV